MTLGEKIKNLRQSRNMTQQDVARALDITRQAVARWENGLNMPSAEKIIELAGLFEVPVSELVGGKAENGGTLRARVLDVAKVFAAYALLYVVCTLASERVATPVLELYGLWYWCSRHFVLPLCFFVSALAWDSGFVRMSVAVFVGLCIGLIFSSVWDAAVYTGPAGQETGFAALIVIVALAAAVGFVLEFKAGTLSGDVFAGRKRPRIALCALLILLAVLSMSHITNRLSYISGANDGWQAGFEAGRADCMSGEDYDSSDSSTDGALQYGLGWSMYYSEGYAAGYSLRN